MQNGQSINIVNGWIEKENTTGKDGKKYTNTIVVITDFVLSDFKSYDDGTEELSEADMDISDVSPTFR